MSPHGRYGEIWRKICHVETFLHKRDVETNLFCQNSCCFVVKSVLLPYTLFCCERYFVAIYALLCGEKFNQKLCLWRKMDKYQLCAILEIFFFLFSTETSTNNDTNYGEDNYVELLHPNAIGCSNVVHFGLK